MITEVAGHIKLHDFVDGLTVTTQVDEVTGLSSTVVMDSKQRGGKDLRPTIRLLSSKGKEITFANTIIPAVYNLPPGALVNLTDGAKVSVGDIIARIPQESSKTRDITGGLPRVADLFEARKPKDQAILAEKTGTVSFGKVVARSRYPCAPGARRFHGQRALTGAMHRFRASESGNILAHTESAS